MTTDAAWEYHPEVHGHRCIECDGLAVWLYVDRSLDGPLVGRDRYCQACATDRFMAE